MQTRPIEFIRQGQRVKLDNVATTRTLLDVLREDLGCTDTKEGCGEGDCGACTVALGEAVDGKLQVRAINSCIRLAHSVDGLAVWTAKDLCGKDGSLHPAQQAMVECHGSQCGFCTPGFVMSMFGMYQNHVAKGTPITRQLAQEDLSGNLCRCTGYRPILDAAQRMAELPAAPLDETEVLRLLQALQQERSQQAPAASDYMAPTSLAELLRLRAAHPQAQIVAGTTDVGLWITKMHKDFPQVLDVTRVAELRRIETHTDHVAIGAAVSLHEAFAALQSERPQLHTFFARFAGLPVRNSGTLGGNVANGSPIGDSMPLLIALGAQVVLMSAGGSRQLPLEQLYTGYRQNVMRADEVLAHIIVPRPQPGELLRAYKVSKRFDDDISAVCLAVALQVHEGVVQRASIGVGGVAATPVRASQAEAGLLGQPWTEASAQAAGVALQTQFKPISDMRASAEYRHALLGTLLQRFWLESQGQSLINLDALTTVDALADIDRPGAAA